MASIHISMCDNETALQFLQKSMQLWQPRRRQPEMDQRDEGDEGDDTQDCDCDEGTGLPPYEFRINTAKLAIELGQLDSALHVLEQLLSEDDHIMQVIPTSACMHCIAHSRGRCGTFMDGRCTFKTTWTKHVTVCSVLVLLMSRTHASDPKCSHTSTSC